MANAAARPVQTVPAKYVYLDIVEFTRDRSIEAQADIVARLNAVVRAALSSLALDAERILLLPTGDGICIAFLNIDAPYDPHLQLGLSILEGLDRANAAERDPRRRFQVRIGINANVDNLITDITGGRNLAGAGINFAQRIMALADGGQILVSHAVYEGICHRERYMNAFREYRGTAKHGIGLPVYQYVREGHAGLVCAEPTAFASPEALHPRLTEGVAYYLAHAIRIEHLFRSEVDRPAGGYWAVILLWWDAQARAAATPGNPFRPRTWGAGQASTREQFAYYLGQDAWVSMQLYDFIVQTHLQRYVRLFDQDQRGWGFVFVTREGRERLRAEWPAVWRDLELEGMEEDNDGQTGRS
jgi:class 3 adenylate cyclase